MGLSLISCDKDNDSNAGDPVNYNLIFEMYRSDGTIYGDNELQISGAQELINGQLRPIGNGELFWFDLGRLSGESQNNGSNYFGICGSVCEDFYPLGFASSAEGSDIGDNEIWEKDKYWVLSYPNNDIDTLRINHKVTKNLYTLTFKFFVNEAELNVMEGDFDQYYITIQK